MPKILRVKDKADNFIIEHKIIPDIPFRILVIGKSMLSGKSNLLTNLILRNEFYQKYFKGENIYIVSPSLESDEKLKILINVKEIPPENLFNEYDEDVLKELYKMIEEEYKQDIENKKRPVNSLIIFDDVSYSGDLKKKRFGIINKIFSNGRHINLSCLVTSQKYSDVLTSARSNMSGGFFFNMSDNQLDQVEKDHNYNMTKKEFYRMFRDNVKERHDFILIDYTKKNDDRYINNNFEVIKNII
jgi:hypothetical protein